MGAKRKSIAEECVAAPREGLRGVRYFVVDEADRMLDMGFMPQVREIVGLMGGRRQYRQSLMFSATWPPVVNAFAEEFLHEDPVRLSVDQADSDGLCANKSIKQEIEIHLETKKEARLLELLKEEGAQGKVLIFVNTKKGCAALAERLGRTGVRCGAIHGNLMQAEREKNLADFVRSATRVLAATDVAARGLDVDDITLVVNYDFPDSMVGGLDDYVHRIGRTGRAGRQGRAVTFFPAPEDVSGTRSAGNAHELINILRSSGQVVPKSLVALDNGPPVVKAIGGKVGKKGKGKDKHRGEGEPDSKRARLSEVPGAFPGITIRGFEKGAIPEPTQRFEDAAFGKKIVRELIGLGFKEPTSIQAHGWPIIASGRDCISIAKTGSGKTLAFLLPAFEYIRKWLKQGGSDSVSQNCSGVGPLALVIAPTRELAVQIHDECTRFAGAAPSCRTACAYGGAPWEPQAASLEAGVELLVATPGRLAFLMGRGGEAAATVTRTIVACGTQKLLANATTAYRDFIANGGFPTRHVLSALLNAHILSGDRAGASSVAQEMQDRNFNLGVVEYTTLLKGDFAAGDLFAAQKIIDTMLDQQPPVWPDLRTANTFMRGCMKLGEAPAAIDFFARLAEWGIAPDATTYKVIIQCLGQSLRLKEMLQYIEQLESVAASAKEALDGLDNAVGLNLSVAQVSCLLGQKRKGKNALSNAEAALASAPAPQSQFENLRRREFASEAKRLRSALNEDELFDLVGGLSRTFAFPAQRLTSDAFDVQAKTEHAQSVSTIASVCNALRRGFGVDECIRRGLCDEQEFEHHLRKCFSKKNVLRWPRVFGTTGIPTRLEVCSGTGDWVVAQAKAEAGKANWIASELRYDRVQSILAKMVLSRVDNLCLLAGDAGSIVRNHIAAASVSTVCINFPEPPQTTRNASCDDAESQLHLLTPDFFRDVHAVLVDGGVLTIFSDNQEYTLSLARILGGLREHGARMFDPFPDMPEEHLETVEEMCGMLVCQAVPGPEAGHIVTASSQFDRFFEHGQHKERYYVSAVRV